MKLIDRYLLREMIVPFLIGQGAIVLMLTGSILYNNANVLLMNQIPMVYIAKMVLYFLPFLIHMTMPVAMAVAASLMVSRLGRDSEITVMRSAGISLRRVFRIVFIMGFLVSVGDFFFGEYVVPHAVRRLDAVVQEMAINIPNLRPQSGQFIVSSDQAYAIYVENMTQKKGYLELRNIVITSSPKLTARGKTDPITMSAETGRFQGGKWTLNNPFFTQFSVKGDKLIFTHPETFSLQTVVDPQTFQNGFLLQIPMWQMARSSTRTFVQMGEDIVRNRQLKIRDDYTLLDYHFKLSVPFSCLVMAICCAPIALRFSKGGGFMGTLLSICLVFVYWNTLLLSRILGSPGPSGGLPLVHPTVAAWSQNIAFVLLGLWVLRKSE